MLSFLALIFFIVILFRLTVFFFQIVGKILGGIFSVIGWLVLGGLAVTIFGLAFFVLPIVLIIGVIALIVAAVS